MNAVTSNSSDERNLSPKELGDLVLRLKGQPALKALQVSRATLLSFPQGFKQQPSLARLYGVPVEIDNSLDLFDAKPVYK